MKPKIKGCGEHKACYLELNKESEYAHSVEKMVIIDYNDDGTMRGIDFQDDMESLALSEDEND